MEFFKNFTYILSVLNKLLMKFFFMLDGTLFAGDGFFVHVSVLSELYITQLYIEIKKAVKER